MKKVARERMSEANMIVRASKRTGWEDAALISVSTSTAAPEEMKAVCVELKGEAHELDGAKFDLVTVSYSLPHASSRLPRAMDMVTEC